MRMRHGIVVTAGPLSATVTIDGTNIEVPVPSGRTITVGSPAVVLEDGRRAVAIGSITLPPVA